MGFTELRNPRRIGVSTFNWTSGTDTVTIDGETPSGEHIAEKITILENSVSFHTNKTFVRISKLVFSRAGDNASQYVVLGTIPKEYVMLTARFPLINFMLPPMVGTLLGFLARWFVNALIMFVGLKIFRQKEELVGNLFIIVGYALSVRIVYGILSAILSSMFPVVVLPLEVWGAPESSERSNLIDQIYSETWYSTWAYQIGFYLPYLINAWIALLCGIGLYSTGKLSLMKSAVVSVVIYAANLLITFFLA